MANCCICDRSLRGSAWVCVPCERRYRLPADFVKWPDWAKALADSEQRERRYQKMEAEQRSGPLDAHDEGVLRPYQSILVTRADCHDGLPLSPYPTAAENSEYRRLHNLPDPLEP